MLDYHFMCERCHMIRVVRRTDSAAVDALPAEHEFRCEDIGIECDVPLPDPLRTHPTCAPPPGSARDRSSCTSHNGGECKRFREARARARGRVWRRVEEEDEALDRDYVV